MLECDKCKGIFSDEFKFCPHCGDPVTENDRPVSDVSSSNVSEAVLTFGYSKSASYQKAVDIVKKIPSYTETGEEKDITHSVKLPVTEIELLLNLYDIVGNWKSARLLINNIQRSKSDLVYYGLGCYQSRLKAYDQISYCFGDNQHEYNIWGCKRLAMPLSEWGGGWLSMGIMDQNGIWHFDKDRLKHEIILKLHENELCPVLDRQRILDTLDKLPGSIDPRTNNKWEYITNYEMINGEYREVAVGIKPVLKRATGYILGNYRPSWQEEQHQTASTYTINLELPEPFQQTGNKHSASHKGCTSIITLFTLIIIIIVLIITA